MAAGISDRLWSMVDIVALIDATESEPKKRGPYKAKPGGSITRLMREPPHDVRSHLEITDAGKKFLEIRDELLKEEGAVPAMAT
jgi:hypothetical protein